MNKILLIISAVFSLVFSNVHAQNNERPKVGLALSGGGAKGMAHIGVIKAMEEAGLYPDYITGTSMGSIIGALYAMGYSADELEEIALGIRWEEVLTNNIPFNRVAIEEKPYYARYFIELPIRNGKVGLPQGLIEGQELTMKLNNMTRSAHTVSNFHELPIPFECVAADIEHGEAVVLKEGSLPEAMRASMSIPSVFTPTMIDSTLYVDGGLLRNFPVQEVKDMGADIVIGVFVSSDLDKKEDLTSMVAVLSQSAFVFSAHDSNEQKKLADIYIEPDLTDFSTASFWSASKIIEQGNKAGQQYLEVFETLADSLNQFGPPAIPKRPALTDQYVFETIEIIGNSKVPKELILGKLRIAPNQIIDINELESRINLLYGTLYFTKVAYTIDTANKKLIITVKEGPPGSIKLAAHYDNDNKAGINFNVTFRNFLLPSSRFIFEYDLAQNPSATLNYFKYLGKKQNLAVVLNGLWLQSELPSYFNESSSESYKSNSSVNFLLKHNVVNPFISFQGTSKSNSTFGAKFNYLNHTVTPLVLDSIGIDGVNYAFQKLSVKDWGAQVFFKTNTFNKPFFPTRGVEGSITIDYMFDRTSTVFLRSNTFGDSEQNPIPNSLILTKLSVNSAFPIMEKLALLTKVEVSINNASDNLEDRPYETLIGGNRPLGWSVYSYEATPAKRFGIFNYSTLSIGLQWEMAKSFYASAKVDYLESEYPMKWIDTSIKTKNIGAHQRRLGFSGKLSYNSIIGPIEFGIGKDQYLEGVHVFFGLGYYIKR